MASLKFQPVGPGDPVCCIGATACNIKECHHYKPHGFGNEVGVTKRCGTFIQRKISCDDINYCDRVKGFVRCVHMEDFKRLIKNPNLAFALEKPGPNFDQ